MSTKALIALLLALALAPRTAHASLIQYSSTPIASNDTADYGWLVPRFNPANGTLNSIRFWAAANVTGQIQCHPLDAPATFDLYPNCYAYLSWYPYYSVSPGNATTATQISVGGGAWGTAYIDTILRQERQLSGGTSDFLYAKSVMVGTGNAYLTLHTAAPSYGIGMSPGGRYQTNQDLSAVLTGGVTYDYNATPEPGLLSLVALGFVGPRWWRKRTRRRLER